MVFDDKYIDWCDDDFPSQDWSDFYPDLQSDVTVNAPTPQGKPIQIKVFVDASHARNKVTRRCHTGVLHGTNHLVFQGAANSGNF
jgi:hypothetical protein